MLVNITGVGCKPEVVEYLNSIATPNDKLPEYWSINTDITNLFTIIGKIDKLGMVSVATMSFNLRQSVEIPSIHLYNKE